MGDYIPRFKPGEAVTYTAVSDVSGGQIVALSGPRSVTPASNGAAEVVGLAAFDTKAGERVTVHSGGVQRPVASGAITAGDQVQAAIDGKASTGTTNPIGLALTTAADGDQVEVLWK